MKWKELPRSCRAAVATALLACGALLLAAIAVLSRERAWEMERARLAARASVSLLEAHTTNTFRAVDLALEDFAEKLATQEIPRHDPRMRELMRSRLAGLPYVRAIFVIGPDGFIRHDTDHPATPDVSLADRAYFKRHQAPDAPARSVSGPLQSRSGLGWFVASSRRIGPGPAFQGIVVAAIQLRYFSELYERAGLAEGSRIYLFHRDGRLIAQHPSQLATIGTDYAEQPLFTRHLPKAAAGVYETDAPPLPQRRIISYATAAHEPLVVAYAQDVDASLAPWRRTVRWAAVGLLLLFTVVGFGTLQYVRARIQSLQARERLHQGEKMEALGQLTGTIAHDLNNLLGILSLNAELLKRLPSADPNFPVALGRIEQAIANGTQMARRLLSFSRQRELAPAETDLNEAIAAFLPLLQQAAGGRVTVRFAPSTPLETCRVDRSQLETALVNLVVNARDALPEGGEVLLRTGILVRDGAQLAPKRTGQRRFVCVTVSDNGQGMTAAVRQRAIEPFFSTKGEGGTGLGLAQVYGFMRALGGDLAIDSEVGKGTSVRLCIPAGQGFGDSSLAPQQD